MSRLTREDWAAAGLDALAAGGVAAVAVEPVAARLGASKGSFYWHFSSRADLVAAALELWERQGTQEVIDELEAAGSPASVRLRRLFGRAFQSRTHASAELALLADADHEPVRTVVCRVTERRIDYLADLMVRSGVSANLARRRAAHVYTAFLGNLHLMRSAPEVLRAAVGPLDAYADDVVAELLVADDG